MKNSYRADLLENASVCILSLSIMLAFKPVSDYKPRVCLSPVYPPLRSPPLLVPSKGQYFMQQPFCFNCNFAQLDLRVKWYSKSGRIYVRIRDYGMSVYTIHLVHTWLWKEHGWLGGFAGLFRPRQVARPASRARSVVCRPCPWRFAFNRREDVARRWVDCERAFGWCLRRGLKEYRWLEFPQVADASLIRQTDYCSFSPNWKPFSNVTYRIKRLTLAKWFWVDFNSLIVCNNTTIISQVWNNNGFSIRPFSWTFWNRFRMSYSKWTTKWLRVSPYRPLRTFRIA